MAMSESNNLMSFNAAGTFTPNAVTKEDCARLSGPGLKAFRHITSSWGLNTNEQIKLLGTFSRSTYYTWLRRQKHGERIVLPPELLIRISVVLNIHRNLVELFPIEEEALTWLHGTHGAPDFNGRTPLAVLVEDGDGGVDVVARYLSSWRFG